VTTVNDLLQPGKTGLVISTGKQDPDCATMFLWNYGRPRRIGTAPYFIHHPLQHQDKVYAFVGPDPLEGVYTRNQLLAECFQGFRGERFSSEDRLVRAVSVRGSLLAIRDSDTVVYDEKVYHGGYRKHEFVRCSPHGLEHVFESENMALYPAVVNDALFFVDNKPLGIDLAEWSIRKWNGATEQLVAKLDPADAYRCATAHKGKLHIGGVGAITTFTASTGDVSVDFVDEEVAHAYKTLRGVDVRSSDFLFTKFTRLLDERKIKDRDVTGCSAQYDLYCNFQIEHIAALEDQVLYAVGKKLYMAGQKAPIWSFRHPITGLAVIESEPLVETLAGKTSVRRGVKQGVALRLAA
jgi:hypothetical protein